MKRPYIGRIWRHTWTDEQSKERTPGIALGGLGGISAHLTKAEAYALSDWITDQADKLPEVTTGPPSRQQTHCGLAPIHTIQTLTAADGTPEPQLPATPAD